MINTFNQQLFFFINRAAGQYTALDHFFLFVTTVFVPVLVIGSLIWFFFVLPRFASRGPERFRRYRDACLLVLSLSITWCIVELIKGVISFPRPQELLTGVHALSTFGSLDSFPSAHTAFAFAVATFVYQYSRTDGLLVFLFATLVGVSRIFVGVHFPLDVIAGATIGIFVPWSLISLLRRYTF